MVSKKTKPKIVWHYGTWSAISGFFSLYISYEGLPGKQVQCAIVPYRSVPSDDLHPLNSLLRRQLA